MDAARLTHFDAEQFADNLGSAQAMREILPAFLTSGADCLTRLEEANADNNLLSWNHVAHELKGLSLAVTARRLGELCIEAETVTALPDTQATSILYHLQKELNILREIVGGLLA